MQISFYGLVCNKREGLKLAVTGLTCKYNLFEFFLAAPKCYFKTYSISYVLPRSLKLSEYHEQDEILRLRSAGIKKVRHHLYSVFSMLVCLFFRCIYLLTQAWFLAANKLMSARGANACALKIFPKYSFTDVKKHGQLGWLNSLWRRASTVVFFREPLGS